VSWPLRCPSTRQTCDKGTGRRRVRASRRRPRDADIGAAGAAWDSPRRRVAPNNFSAAGLRVRRRRQQVPPRRQGLDGRRGVGLARRGFPARFKRGSSSVAERFVAGPARPRFVAAARRRGGCPVPPAGLRTNCGGLGRATRKTTQARRARTRGAAARSRRRNSSKPSTLSGDARAWASRRGTCSAATRAAPRAASTPCSATRSTSRAPRGNSQKRFARGSPRDRSTRRRRRAKKKPSRRRGWPRRRRRRAKTP